MYPIYILVHKARQFFAHQAIFTQDRVQSCASVKGQEAALLSSAWTLLALLLRHGAHGLQVRVFWLCQTAQQSWQGSGAAGAVTWPAGGAGCGAGAGSAGGSTAALCGSGSC